MGFIWASHLAVVFIRRKQIPTGFKKKILTVQQSGTVAESQTICLDGLSSSCLFGGEKKTPPASAPHTSQTRIRCPRTQAPNVYNICSQAEEKGMSEGTGGESTVCPANVMKTV